MREQQSFLSNIMQVVTIGIVNYSFIYQRLFLSFLHDRFMTLHFVATHELKTVVKKSDGQRRRSGAGSYPIVALLRLPLPLNLDLNVSCSSDSSSGKNGLLRGFGYELRVWLQHPVEATFTKTTNHSLC